MFTENMRCFICGSYKVISQTESIFSGGLAGIGFPERCPSETSNLLF